MARIHVSFKEAKRAFDRFLKHAPDPQADACCCLDALYAAECGLAAIIMKENKYSNTTSISITTPHNLHEMAKLCRMAPIPKLPATIAVQKVSGSGRTSENYSFSDFHSILRYGASMDRAKLKAYADCIKKLCQWIKTVLEAR